MWKCECSCGAYTEVPTKYLTTGGTRSCGCLKKDEHLARFTTHGESNSRLYQTWAKMNNRCSNCNSPVYKDYGGRGINVCEEWKKSYESFRSWAIDNGYSDDLTLDRIDVNSGYNPSNCRWTDWITQGNNKRNNRYVELDGDVHTISEWSRITGLNKTLIRERLNAGWSAENALTVTPVAGGAHGIRGTN